MPIRYQPRYVPTPCGEAPEAGRLLLRDGSTAQVHLATAADLPGLLAFFAQLSPEARYRRFFSAAVPSPETLARLCDDRDMRQACTLLVTRLYDGVPLVVATGSYLARDAHSAEVAFAVAEPLQGLGLGTLLLERLAVLAVRHGFSHFWAVTQADNRAMLELFRESGFAAEERLEDGTLEVNLTVVPTEASVARSELRDRLATAESLRPFFRPSAVAVVGASRDPASIGGRVIASLVAHGFQGPIYPINPNAPEVAGLRAYPSMRELPQRAELAVIVVPRDQVPVVVDDCAAAGVRALVVITAGFAEVGGEGRVLQQQLVDRVRGHGMRMIGPNCLGLLNADPAVRLNASFAPLFPPAGRVALSSQSGALGLAILAAARRVGLGISTFVSVGNKADVSTNDLLQYWEDDPATDVILLYVESFGNPRRFARIARRVCQRKPVVALKAGRTPAGERAAGSHTAALAAREVAVDALFRQTGMIRAETLEEMFDLAALLGSQPLPAGRRLGILTNAGGPGILCADACEAGGLVLPELSAATRARLAAFLPSAAGLGNPVDMIASAGPEEYRQAIATLLSSGEIDSLIWIYIPAGLAVTAAILTAAQEGVRAAGTSPSTMLACLMTEQGGNTLQGEGATRVPCFAFPEAAGRTLARVAAYAEGRMQPPGVVPDFDDLDLPAARAICRTALQTRGPGWLTAAEARAVLEAVRLPTLPGGVVTTAEEAVALAQRVGFPVAVKLASRTLVHKTEIGGVHLNLGDRAAVQQAVEAITARLRREHQLDALEGFLVQPMVTHGVEVLIGVTQDPSFGPLVAFGLGGIHVEILADVCFRVTPLTDRDAADMVQSLRGARLFQGYRGHPPADVPAIEELLLRVARLAEEVPQLAELDLNPVYALGPGQGCRIVDARIAVRASSR